MSSSTMITKSSKVCFRLELEISCWVYSVSRKTRMARLFMNKNKNNNNKNNKNKKGN